ncbi:MAG: hypothetical protein ACRC8Y_26120 [Chroococcales cyanobacterium]
MMNTKLMNTTKLLSLLLALPVLFTTGSDTFARDGRVNVRDPELFLGSQSPSWVTRDEATKPMEQLMAARGEQPGKCELLGICK